MRFEEINSFEIGQTLMLLAKLNEIDEISLEFSRIMKKNISI